MLYYLMVGLHILICFFLVIVVLLQSGKAADLAGAFGGMGSQTAFGPRGSATILSKATTIAAALFMVTSLTLAILATRGSQTTSGGVLGGQPPARTQQTPARGAPHQPPAGMPTTSGQVGGTTSPAAPMPVPPPAQPQPRPAAPPK
ncbi:MAG: preprotein translocase subunit SecG [Bryobacteraceae bacterium]|jgi:preprotein translocase subunit SecG